MDNRNFGFVGFSSHISEIRQNGGSRCAECGCWLLPAVGGRRYLWRECFGRAESCDGWGLRNSGNPRRRYADDHTSDFMTDFYIPR